MIKKKHTSVSLLKMFGYALGEGATSITMNGISNFAMLFYTQVLGLNAAYAGIALSITTLWDAVTDPVMGHITDNTRSRFGRRHPYLFWGGLALAVSFFLLWILPGQFTTASAIFWCVLLINLAVRTAVTVFVVPYTALGFEICPEYVDRSRLQGIRYFINQMVNLVFGACAWSLFFRDGIAEDGSRLDGTLILQNYQVMGAVLALATFIVIVSCIWATREYATDSRSLSLDGNSLSSFFRDIGAIFKDRVAWYVFSFFGIAQLSMLLVSQIQMFTYVHYMQFSSGEKSFVHGAGMVAFALGSLSLSKLVARFDKKAAGYVGIAVSMLGGLLLFGVFSTGLLAPKAVWSAVPVAIVVFALCQGMWWGGCGILVPLALSMIADISAINRQKTGIAKDGSYSAVFSFIIKAATSFGLLITGGLLTLAGIVSGVEHQTEEAARNVSVMTFLIGPFLVLTAFFILRKYPIDRAFMENLTAEADNE